ncbi:hypothetical protein AEJ54_26435 [Azospirillum sp. Sp 7]|nr:hypothetical protein AEJ54_26435 [Azospirillum sp. Sp 7]
MGQHGLAANLVEVGARWARGDQSLFQKPAHPLVRLTLGLQLGGELGDVRFDLPGLRGQPLRVLGRQCAQRTGGPGQRRMPVDPAAVRAEQRAGEVAGVPRPQPVAEDGRQLPVHGHRRLPIQPQPAHAGWARAGDACAGGFGRRSRGGLRPGGPRSCGIPGGRGVGGGAGRGAAGRGAGRRGRIAQSRRSLGLVPPQGQHRLAVDLVEMGKRLAGGDQSQFQHAAHQLGGLALGLQLGGELGDVRFDLPGLRGQPLRILGRQRGQRTGGSGKRRVPVDPAAAGVERRAGEVAGVPGTESVAEDGCQLPMHGHRELSMQAQPAGAGRVRGGDPCIGHGRQPRNLGEAVVLKREV